MPGGWPAVPWPGPDENGVDGADAAVSVLWRTARPNGFGATTPDGFTLAVFRWSDDPSAVPPRPWAFEVQTKAPAALARRRGTTATAAEARRMAEAALREMRQVGGAPPTPR